MAAEEKNWDVYAANGNDNTPATGAAVVAAADTSLIRAKGLLVTRQKGGVKAMAADLASMLESSRLDGVISHSEKTHGEVVRMRHAARDRAIASYIAMRENPAYNLKSHHNSPVMVSASLMNDMIDALREAGYSRDGKANNPTVTRVGSE